MNKILPLFLLVFSVLIGCNEKADLYTENYTLIIKDQVFGINSDEDLSKVMKKLIAKKDDNTVRINKVAINQARDVQGEYKYISAKYSIEDRLITAVAILEQLPGENVYRYVCTMTCDPKDNCQRCKQTVITECVSQTCVCDLGTGGCKSSISF